MALKTQACIPWLQTKLGPRCCFFRAHEENVGCDWKRISQMCYGHIWVIYHHSACFVAIVFTSKYETTSSIFLRIKREPHKLWMASDSYVFGDGLLYVFKDYTCIHNTLPWLRQDSWITKGKNIVIVTLILTMRATKHYVTSFKFLGSVVASKKTTNCVWMILKKLPCTESERVNRED